MSPILRRDEPVRPAPGDRTEATGDPGSLRIVFVLDDSLDPPDGVQQYVLTLGRRFTDLGHEVHYVVGRSERTDVPGVHSLSATVPVSFNRNRMRTPLPASRRRVAALLADLRPQVLHVQAPFSPLLAGRVIAAAPDDVAVVSTFHIAPNSRLVRRANDALGRVVRRSTARVDRHLAVSGTAADFALDAYGARCAVVPCPIDVEHFAAAGRADAALPGRAAGPHVVFLGRLVARKGPDHLLAAVARAEELDLLPAGTHVTIGGDGPMRQELERTAARMRTPVRFWGTVTDGPKPGLLASADVAVFPSLTGETFGIVLAEAMASGARVTLGGDNPGYRETLGGRAETLFDPVDTDGFARTLGRALTDPGFVERTSAWQQDHVRTFDVATVAERILHTYGEAVQARTRIR